MALGATPGVQHFVLQENIRRFRARLDETSDSDDRQRLRLLLAAVERELALLEAAETGLEGRSPLPKTEADVAAEATRAAMIEQFRKAFGESLHLAALIDPAPGLVIVDVNRTYELSTGLSRDQIVGRCQFELFPDNPSDPAADGIYNLYTSLRAAAEHHQPQVMALQRYDTQGPDGSWQERWWRPTNTPLMDLDDRLVFLLHTVDEATDEVLRAQAEEREPD